MVIGVKFHLTYLWQRCIINSVAISGYTRLCTGKTIKDITERISKDMRFLRIAAVLSAAVLAVVCTSCSGKDKKSKKSKGSEVVMVSQAAEDSGSTEEIVKVELPRASSGKYIKRVYDLLKSDKYTMRMTYENFEGRTEEVYRVVDGGNYYQLQTNDIGQSGTIRVGEECYDFDMICGIYRKNNHKRLDSMIESTVDEDLPKTMTHINKADAEKYEVEEYTYTGSTYITVVDYYFDKKTGILVKYTVNYMIEGVNGDEEMSETRYIREIISDDGYDLAPTDTETTSAEDMFEGKDVFDLDFMSKLVDFDNMTEDQRLGYCQAIFVTAGVTADELADAKITDRDLKIIGYDAFTSLVYKYYGNDE